MAKPFILPEIAISLHPKPAAPTGLPGSYGTRISHTGGASGDGGSNAQKTPLGQYLDTKVFTRVSNLLQARSGRLPATLHQQKDGDKTNTIWMVNFETDGTYTLPMVAMPVHTNEYTRPPYKQGDKGFVSTADVDTTSMSNLNDQAGPATYARPANLAALVWHPLGNTTFKPAIDVKAHETYGGDSGTITHDGTQKSVVRTHPTDGTVISSGAQGNAQSASEADGPHKMTAHPTDGTKIETPAAHTLQASNATLDAQGNQSNQGNSTTAQNITSTSGNISAASGNVSAAQSVSGASGSFGSGSMGGVGFGGGSFGGLGAIINAITGAASFAASLSTGGMLTAGSADTGSSATADVVSARKYALLPSYTVTQLLAALPPTSTPAGARVFVTDIRNVSAGFGNALNVTSGGGTNGLCATCDGTNWKTG